MRTSSTNHQSCPKCGEPAIEDEVEVVCEFEKAHGHTPPDCTNSCEDCTHLMFYERPGTFSHMQPRSLDKKTVEHQAVHQCNCGQMFVYSSIVIPKFGYR